MCSFAKLGAARGCGTPGIKTTTPGKNASLDATFLSRFSRLFRIGFPVLCYGRGCCNKTTGLAWAAWIGALLLGVSNFGVGQIAASFINYMYVAAAVMPRAAARLSRCCREWLCRARATAPCAPSAHAWAAHVCGSIAGDATGVIIVFSIGTFAVMFIGVLQLFVEYTGSKVRARVGDVAGTLVRVLHVTPTRSTRRCA